MISFCHSSRRNTKCYRISIAGDTFYVSYETIIGASTPDGHVRLHNSWGPTTGRHMNDMGIRSYKEITDEEMQLVIRKSIMRAGLNLAKEPFMKGQQ